MTPHQSNYIRQCYTNYKASLSWCSRCDPKPEPVRKRWDDVVHSVVAYINTSTANMGTLRAFEKSIDVASWSGHTWQGGVFKGDDYDAPYGWYWRIREKDSVQWRNTPAEALISFTQALEEEFKANPAAQGLVFVVRMPEATCLTPDAHDWKYLYTGRHGSDKGDKFYECTACGARKQE